MKFKPRDRLRLLRFCRLLRIGINNCCKSSCSRMELVGHGGIWQGSVKEAKRLLEWNLARIRK